MGNGQFGIERRRTEDEDSRQAHKESNEIEVQIPNFRYSDRCRHFEPRQRRGSPRILRDSPASNGIQSRRQCKGYRRIEDSRQARKESDGIFIIEL